MSRVNYKTLKQWFFEDAYAAAKGYSLLIDRNRKNPKEYQDTQRVNGIDFHYYIDLENKGVTNVHPK